MWNKRAYTADFSVSFTNGNERDFQCVYSVT